MEAFETAEAYMRLGALVAIVILALVASGCAGSRARKAGREGFFNRISKQSRAPSSRDEAIPELRAISGLHWPLKDVEITSRYGERGGDEHEGIDLRAPVGTPVYAAQAGTVLYAGSRISGYGKMVVIKHPSGVSTVYAHNTRMLVIQGQRVKRGQKIAISGRTGRVSGPHLHFEVRNGVVAIDPEMMLPSPRFAAQDLEADWARDRARQQPKRLATVKRHARRSLASASRSSKVRRATKKTTAAKKRSTKRQTKQGYATTSQSRAPAARLVD